MTTEKIILITFLCLVVFSILFAISIIQTLKKAPNVNLTGGKLENSDAFIKDALPYLKITNVWSE